MGSLIASILFRFVRQLIRQHNEHYLTRYSSPYLFLVPGDLRSFWSSSSMFRKGGVSEGVLQPGTSPLDALILDILHTVPLQYLYSELTAITSDPDLPYVKGFFHFFKSSPVLSNQLLFSLSESTGGQTFTHCPDFPYKKPLTQKKTHDRNTRIIFVNKFYTPTQSSGPRQSN